MSIEEYFGWWHEQILEYNIVCMHQYVECWPLKDLNSHASNNECLTLKCHLINANTLIYDHNIKKIFQILQEYGVRNQSFQFYGLARLAKTKKPKLIFDVWISCLRCIIIVMDIYVYILCKFFFMLLSRMSNIQT